MTQKKQLIYKSLNFVNGTYLKQNDINEKDTN